MFKYYENPRENLCFCILDEKSTFTIDYDALIIAVGAETSTFNIKGVMEHTHALKEIFDAQMIRRNIINSFENASYPGRTEEEIKKLLHFVVVGGGPTGKFQYFIKWQTLQKF